MLDPGLAGRRALLTGGASGIGQAIARALAREGVALAIADRGDARATLAAVEAAGGSACALTVDVGSEEAVRTMVADAAQRLGGIDLYVNVAGLARHEPALELTAAAWRETLAVNLDACVWACRDVGRLMAAAGGGGILVVGSTVVHHPAYGEAAYRAAKSGLRSYVETLAIELAPHGVRANMLTPGAFRTPLAARIPPARLALLERVVPLGRQGEPDELGATAVLLLSDALSPYTTGSEVIVDGGLHLHPLPLGRDA